ncbi:hypothetical protein [Paenibacillus sp. YYML68]|uniref:hypothetical protein n=1 Tax=Paenibacillus sp. YYML68 TaxID=2909250 RepID=UPI002490EE92|nr:hypothetical protein [Paenibacillus sp. YYML68]
MGSSGGCSRRRWRGAGGESTGDSSKSGGGDPGNRSVHVYAMHDGKYLVRELYMEKDVVQSVMFKDLCVSTHKLFSLDDARS